MRNSSMKNLFNKGDIKTFTKQVQLSDIAQFDSGTVHEVYATFSIARDAEWSGRLFVLDMKELHEEGIGTHISVQHVSPALVGEHIAYTAVFEEITEKGEIITSFQAFCGERLIAKGTQAQRILPKAFLEKKFADLQP